MQPLTLRETTIAIAFLACLVWTATATAAPTASTPAAAHVAIELDGPAAALESLARETTRAARADLGDPSLRQLAALDALEAIERETGSLRTRLLTSRLGTAESELAALQRSFRRATLSIHAFDPAVATLLDRAEVALTSLEAAFDARPRPPSELRADRSRSAPKAPTR